MRVPQLARERRRAGIADLPLVAAEVGTVRPGRVRNRTTKTEPEEKVKKPVDGVRNKKPPPARKAPARGRYVDEYARPAR
jgi:hypothetical protein